MMKKQIAVYIRNAIRNPKAVKRQLKVCRKMIRSKFGPGANVKVYVDDGASGVSGNRHGLNRLLITIRSDDDHVRPGCIIVEDISRIARDLSLMRDIVNMCDACGVRIIEATTGRDVTNGGIAVQLAITELARDMHMHRRENHDPEKIQSRIGGFVNDLWRKQFSKLMSNACCRRARAGLSTGGRIFGFCHRDHRLAINPKEAFTVNKIFHLFADGMSPNSIANALTMANVPSPQPCPAGWSASTVRRILNNPRYVGVIRTGCSHSNKGE